MIIAPHAYIHHCDTDRAIWYQSALVTIKATAAQTNGAFGLIDVLAPIGFGTPLHVHQREEESFYIIDGEVSFMCGNDQWTATAGSFVFLPRGIAHAFKVRQPTRMLNMITPGGFEQFFADLGKPAEMLTLPPVVPPLDVARFSAIAGAYQANIVGPPLV